MKSIKPGRGPSRMSGVMCVFVALIGVAWTCVAASMGAGFMAIFGMIFIGIAIWQAIYHFNNATGENRPSLFDIVDSDEEPDPYAPKKTEEGGLFCPYCGAKVQPDFDFCSKCGRKLPE